MFGAAEYDDHRPVRVVDTKLPGYSIAGSFSTAARDVYVYGGRCLPYIAIRSALIFEAGPVLPPYCA